MFLLAVAVRRRRSCSARERSFSLAWISLWQFLDGLSIGALSLGTPRACVRVSTRCCDPLWFGFGIVMQVFVAVNNSVTCECLNAKHIIHLSAHKFSFKSTNHFLFHFSFSSNIFRTPKTPKTPCTSIFSSVALFLFSRIYYFSLFGFCRVIAGGVWAVRVRVSDAWNTLLFLCFFILRLKIVFDWFSGISEPKSVNQRVYARAHRMCDRRKQDRVNEHTFHHSIWFYCLFSVFIEKHYSSVRPEKRETRAHTHITHYTLSPERKVLEKKKHNKQTIGSVPSECSLRVCDSQVNRFFIFPDSFFYSFVFCSRKIVVHWEWKKSSSQDRFHKNKKKKKNKLRKQHRRIEEGEKTREKGNKHCRARNPVLFVHLFRR